MKLVWSLIGLVDRVGTDIDINIDMIPMQLCAGLLVIVCLYAHVCRYICACVLYTMHMCIKVSLTCMSVTICMCMRICMCMGMSHTVCVHHDVLYVICKWA
jgi:hypothetical protein